MLEKAMHMNIAEYHPQRIAEWAEYYCFAEAVFSIPEIMPEKIADNGGYIGKHGDNVSVYDAMLAEIYAERNKAKARRVRKPDNRTRAERLADWEEEKLNRKDRRAQYACNHINKKYGYLCIEQERRISAEKVARADYEIELRNIADDAEQMKIEAEYAEWERRYRHEKYMRNLNDWLKYA